MGTGVNAGSGVGDGSTGVPPVGPTGILPVVDGVGDASGVGDDFFGEGDFFGDGVGDAFDFLFADDAFAFFFFAGVGVFFGVGFFFLGDAFGFGLGDFLGVGEVFATASGVSSDESCASAGAVVRTLAISSHQQKRAIARATKKGNLRRAAAPERNFPARARGAESRSVFPPAIATDRSDTSRSAE